jgi:polysaccharide export outer membrane protein
MKHCRAKLIVFTTGILAVGGCSLPGVSFHGVPRQEQSAGEKYRVQPITPSLLAGLAAASVKAMMGSQNPALTQALTGYTYRVQPQDVIAVTVWGHPEFSATGRMPDVAGAEQGSDGSGGGGIRGGAVGGVGAPGATSSPAGFTVDSAGNIFFPYVGTVAVAGLTAEQIRVKLTGALVKYVMNPQVSVSVVGFNSQYYQLAGSVQKPGLYSITNVPVTVSQAIQRAGGVLRTIPSVTVASRAAATPLADLAHVLYVHDGKREVLNLRAFFNNGDESQDRLLHPGDIVQVPDNSYDQIHLIGEVRDPGDYPLDNGALNLASALGKAGGISLTTANASRIFVFRGTYAKPEIFWLDAHSPAAMLLATQFQLQPQDVVYVATAGISTWNRIIEQILPTVQVLAQTKLLTK